MAETTRQARLRIGHLILAVVVSAFVMALLKFPQEYALLLVAVAGFLMIGTCVVAAVVNAISDRRSKRPGRSGSRPGGWMWSVAPVAVMVGLGFHQLERHPYAVIPAILMPATIMLISFPVFLFTWVTMPGHSDSGFWRLAWKNLGVTLVLIVSSLVLAIWTMGLAG